MFSLPRSIPRVHAAALHTSNHDFPKPKILTPTPNQGSYQYHNSREWLPRPTRPDSGMRWPGTSECLVCVDQAPSGCLVAVGPACLEKPPEITFAGLGDQARTRQARRTSNQSAPMSHKDVIVWLNMNSIKVSILANCQKCLVSRD